MTDVVLPHHLTNGEATDADQVMANLQAIVDVVNGLTAENLSTALAALLLRPGMIVMTAGDTPDDGFLLCLGQTVLRDDYPALFARVGTRFNATIDGDHFVLPNFQDCIAMGASAGGTVPLGGTGGAATATLVESNIPVRWVTAVLTQNPDVAQHAVLVYRDDPGGGSTFVGSQPVNNLPPILGVNFEIKT